MNEKIIKYSKITIFILALLLYASYISFKVTLPAAQDLPREMHNGQMVLEGKFDVLTKNFYSYTEPDQPFANHHWLSGVFYYLQYQIVGWDGMVLFKIVFMLVAFSVLFYLALKRSDFWLAAFFSAPTIIILASRGALRPEMFSFFFIILFLYLLYDLEKHPESKKIFWLIPLQLLWVNMHLYFPIGVLMVLGFLTEKVILTQGHLAENPLIKKLSVVFVAIVAMCFINPYGISGAIFALQVNKDANFPIASQELSTIFSVLKSSPRSQNVPVTLFEILSPILILSFVWAIFYRWRKKQPLFSGNIIFYFLASVGTIGLGFYIIRALPLFAIIFLPAISSNLGDSFFVLKKWLKSKWPKKENIIKISAVIFLLVIFMYEILHDIEKTNWDDFGIGITTQAEGSKNFFLENKLSGPIFNNTDIGSYLIYYLYPQEKVFTDNRFGDAYSASFFSDIYLPMTQDEEKWQASLKKYNFNVLFLNHYDDVGGMRDFMNKRINDPEWTWVYADNYVIILVRNIPKNKDIIDKYRIDWQNIVDQLSYLSKDAGTNDQLTSADLLNLAGQHPLAINGYMRYLLINPHNGKVWSALGSTELNRYDQENSNSALAALFLERAISEGWKTPETYSYLALAYYRLGEFNKAKEAVDEELKIDPSNKDGHRWLEILAELN